MLVEVDGVSRTRRSRTPSSLGVSHYPSWTARSMTRRRASSSGLANLSSAARSASELAAWLLERVPLPGGAAEGRAAGALARRRRSSCTPTSCTAIGGPDQARPPGDGQGRVHRVQAGVRGEPGRPRPSCSSSATASSSAPRGAIVLLEDFATADEEDLLFGALDVIGCHDVDAQVRRQPTGRLVLRRLPPAPEIVKRLREPRRSLSSPATPGRPSVARLTRLPASSTRRERLRRPSRADHLHRRRCSGRCAAPGAVGAGREPVPPGTSRPSRLSTVLPHAGEGAGAGRWGRPVRRPHRQAASTSSVQQFAEPPQVDIEVAPQPADLDPLRRPAQLRFEGTQPVDVGRGGR
jgi:hypothetical protein